MRLLCANSVVPEQKREAVQTRQSYERIHYPGQHGRGSHRFSSDAAATNPTEKPSQAVQ